MGYALVPLVRPQAFPNGRRRGRRPFGYDATEHNFVVLDPGDPTQDESGLVLVWHETDVSDRRVVKIADGHAERLTGTARAALARWGGRAFNAADPFNVQIAQALNLRPRLNGDVNLWLGPGGRGANRFFHTNVGPRHHSKTWVDTFNRADGALNGTTLSAGGASWVATLWTTTSNAAVFAGVDVNDFAVLDTDTDSDDMYAQVDIAVNDNGDYAEAGIAVNLASDFSSGYIAHCNTPGRLLYAVSTDTDLGSDAITTTSGTLKIVRDGTDVEQFINGVSVLGPTTDTGEATGTGKRRVGMFAYTFLAGASVTFDNLLAGDIIDPTPNHILLDAVRVRPYAFSPGFAR